MKSIINMDFSFTVECCFIVAYNMGYCPGDIGAEVFCLGELFPFVHLSKI